ncbi:hypothetical protein, partial [Desulfovibrio sp.]|uniref:hypothetical protein n=1 Tax=Desulfovibrio sp. TaxID=885 RepID=UPI0030798C1F
SSKHRYLQYPKVVVIPVATPFLFHGGSSGLQYGEKKGRISQASTEDRGQGCPHGGSRRERPGLPVRHMLTEQREKTTSLRALRRKTDGDIATAPMGRDIFERAWLTMTRVPAFFMGGQ